MSPTAHGHYLNVPLGVEVVKQQLYLGNRDVGATLSQKWFGLMSSVEGDRSGRRLPAMGPTPPEPTGAGRRLSAVGTGVPGAGGAESSEIQFALPSQYRCDKYRDTSVPLSAGPVDSTYPCSDPVIRRAAWSSCFLRLVEALMRIIVRGRQDKVSEQVSELKANPDPMVMTQILTDSHNCLNTNRGFIHPMLMCSLAEGSSTRAFITPPPAPPARKEILIISDSTLYLRRGTKQGNYLNNEELQEAFSSSECRIVFIGNGVTTKWSIEFAKLADTLKGTRNGQDTTLFVFWSGHDFGKRTVEWDNPEARQKFQDATAKIVDLKRVFRDVFVFCPSMRNAWMSSRMWDTAITSCMQAVEYTSQFLQVLPTDAMLHAMEDHRYYHEQKRRGAAELARTGITSTTMKSLVQR